VIVWRGGFDQAAEVRVEPHRSLTNAFLFVFLTTDDRQPTTDNRSEMYNAPIRKQTFKLIHSTLHSEGRKGYPLMKRMFVLFGVLILALPLVAQMGDNMKAGGGVAQAVTQMEQQWASNSKAGNADAVAANLADNFIELDSDGSLYTKAQVVDRMKNSKWQMNEVSNIKVTVHGNTAIATGGWQGKGTVAGKAVDSHENWLDTWMKMPSGKWQCIASASAPAKM
jgi:ketosteroid isomerase-like protein